MKTWILKELILKIIFQRKMKNFEYYIINVPRRWDRDIPDIYVGGRGVSSVHVMTRVIHAHISPGAKLRSTHM